MKETALYLYIFSGPHLGAKIALSEGKHIIGSDDSSDIVFFNQNSSKDFAIAPRHASINVQIEREVLTVQSNENPEEQLEEIPEEILNELPSEILDDIKEENINEIFEEVVEEKGKIISITVTVSSIDGSIYQELGADALESFVAEKSEAFYIASTCMVWNLPDQVQETILPKLASNVSYSEENENSQETDETKQNDNEVAPTLEDADNEVAKARAIEEAKQEKKKFIRKAALSGLVAIGLLTLSIAYEPQNDNIGLEVNYLTAQLAEEKIENVELFQQIINGKESILIQGYVNNESERQKIQTLARRLQYPVYISVEVQNDLLRAVQDSFALFGIYPSLYIKDSELHVDAYIQDSLLEEAAFATLNKDITDLPTIKRNVIHEIELSQLIDEKLTVDGIHNADTQYGKGVISILGVFTPTDKKNIHTSMNEIIDKLSIPLHYSLSHSVAAQSLANSLSTGIDDLSSNNSVTTTVEQVEGDQDLRSLISVSPNSINFGDQIGSIEFVNEYGENVSLTQSYGQEAQNLSSSIKALNQNQIQSIISGKPENLSKELLDIQSRLNAMSQDQAQSLEQIIKRLQNEREITANGNLKLSNKARVNYTNTKKSNTVVPIKPITISGLKINSIHNGNIPFLTTSEGQRLFVGAFLPNGFTLEAIASSQISIRKGTQRVTISLDR